jgi:hypothetical protein
MSKLRAALADVGAVLRDDRGAATAEYAIATMATIAGIERTQTPAADTTKRPADTA